MNYRAWTDGGCQPNPGNGGWAFVLHSPDGSIVERSGAERDTTNIRMELRAAIEAMRHIPEGSPAIIYSDCKMVVEVLSERWRARKNPPLVKWARRLARKHDVTFEWVRGHNGDPGNERADTLATEAMNELGPAEPRLSVLMGERLL